MTFIQMYSFIISIAALVLGYVLYGRLIDRIFGPDSHRQTPAVSKADGVDYVPMPTWKVYMIQLLNIAGTGPIFGAISGALFGPVVYLWIVFGCIFAGAVHDYMTGMLSVRKYFLSWYRAGGFPATEGCISKVYYADPETDIDDLLEKMSAAKVTMAVVREKDSGATLGIITIEDILEELVGDIYDENDPVKGESV